MKYLTVPTPSPTEPGPLEYITESLKGGGVLLCVAVIGAVVLSLWLLFKTNTRG